MKSTKTAELRSKSTDELAKLAAEKTENLFNLKIRRSAGAVESSADIAVTRRDIARVKTILGEKARAAK
jgi:large subunit ribosomal protein L29